MAEMGSWRPRFRHQNPLGAGRPRGVRRMGDDVAVGSCATAPREPSQGRKAAALSGSSGVPQVAWPPRRFVIVGPRDRRTPGGGVGSLGPVAFQSLYRRYRPRRFSEVRGQDHVVRALRNAVARDATSHAYMFSGPRGTGKTSTARILAKALNCEAPVEGEPCCACASCLAVEAGTSLDVSELDAASNNGVDAMRELVGRVAMAGAGRVRLYILDEVHMLSTGASNALLKTLEEPPSHVVFVLATTDPQKVLPTIRSRTQAYEFRLLSADTLSDHLRWVVADAGLEVGDDDLAQAVRKGQGSARDALSALEQIVAAGGGLDDDTVIDEMAEALCERDPARALVALAQACTAGRDPRQLAEALLAHLRNAFLSIVAVEVVSLPDAALELASDQGRRLGAAATVRALDALGEALLAMREAADARVVLEVALVRVTRPEADASPFALLERIERLERSLRGGATPTPDGDRPPLASAPPVAPAGSARQQARQAVTAVRSTAPDPSLAPGSGQGAEAAAVVPVITPAGAGGSRPALGSLRRHPVPPAADEVPSARQDDPVPAAVTPGSPAPRPPADTTPPPPTPRPPADTTPPPPAPAPLPILAQASATPGSSAPGPARPDHGDGDGPALPTRQELTLAWADHVLGGLRPVAKGLFGAGRFAAADHGVVTFALPTDAMRRKCETRRHEVESALAAYFGRPVPLQLAVDGSTAAQMADGGAPGDSLADPFDVDDLRDAPPDPRSGLDRLTQAFPGAEIVDEPSTGTDSGGR